MQVIGEGSGYNDAPRRGGYGPVTPELQEAMDRFRRLSGDQRAAIACWFCSACWRYVGPGDGCTCEATAAPAPSTPSESE